MLSTAPVLGLVLVSVTTRPARVSVMFLFGWAAGILTVAALLVAVVDLSVRPRLPDTAAAIVRLVLGGALGIVALRSWSRSRAVGDTPPSGLASVARWSTSRALAVGFGLGSVNPKNIALVAAGSTAILESGADIRQQAFAVIVFAMVASAGVATPIVLREVGGTALNRGLERAARWMTSHGKTLSVVVLALVAALLVGDGIGRLTA